MDFQVSQARSLTSLGLTDHVIAGGKAQPAMQDNRKLGAAVSRLLGIKTKP
jgi:hypothetical protein